MDRKFRVINEFLINDKNIANKEDIMVLKENEEYIKFENIRLWFHITMINYLIKEGYLEEILPIKTQNLSESDSILDYEKKYNMWDATHLMKNHDVQMIDSKFGFVWEYYPRYKTLNTEPINGVGIKLIESLFEGDFGYVDSLDLTFTLVKPVEEVKEKWVRIEHRKQLCDCVVKNMMTRVLNQNGDLVYKRDNYDERYIHTLFQYLTDSCSGYAIEYLEEN